jgi:hypothetical protein
MYTQSNMLVEGKIGRENTTHAEKEKNKYTKTPTPPTPQKDNKEDYFTESGEFKESTLRVDAEKSGYTLPTVIHYNPKTRTIWGLDKYGNRKDISNEELQGIADRSTTEVQMKSEASKKTVTKSNGGIKIGGKNGTQSGVSAQELQDALNHK